MASSACSIDPEPETFSLAVTSAVQTWQLPQVAHPLGGHVVVTRGTLQLGTVNRRCAKAVRVWTHVSGDDSKMILNDLETASPETFAGRSTTALMQPRLSLQDVIATEMSPNCRCVPWTFSTMSDMLGEFLSAHGAADFGVTSDGIRYVARTDVALFTPSPQAFLVKKHIDCLLALPVREACQVIVLVAGTYAPEYHLELLGGNTTLTCGSVTIALVDKGSAAFPGTVSLTSVAQTLMRIDPGTFASCPKAEDNLRFSIPPQSRAFFGLLDTSEQQSASQQLSPVVSVGRGRGTLFRPVTPVHMFQKYSLVVVTSSDAEPFDVSFSTAVNMLGETRPWTHVFETSDVLGNGLQDGALPPDVVDATIMAVMADLQRVMPTVTLPELVWSAWSVIVSQLQALQAWTPLPTDGNAARETALHKTAAAAVSKSVKELHGIVQAACGKGGLAKIETVVNWMKAARATRSPKNPLSSKLTIAIAGAQRCLHPDAAVPIDHWVFSSSSNADFGCGAARHDTDDSGDGFTVQRQTSEPARYPQGI